MTNSSDADSFSKPQANGEWSIASQPNLRAGDAYDVAAQKFEFQRNVSNVEFWRRLGNVSFEGMRVLEIGCGLGALSVDIASRGAKQVVAIDLDDYRLDFAREHVRKEYPHLTDIIDFYNADISTLVGSFDFVIAKDTFEHVENLDDMLSNIHRLLHPDGRLLAGFGPLYFSPFGDHGRFIRRVPWLPVIFPESILLLIAQRRWGREINSVNDVGLNKLTPKQFRELMDTVRWDAVSVKYNQRIGRLSFLFNFVRQFAFLEKYFTVNIYAKYRRR